MFLHFLSLSTVLVLKYNVTLCDHILNIFQHTNNFCVKKKIKTIKVRVIFFHMENYINTCHMCKKSLKQSLLGRHQC